MSREGRSLKWFDSLSRRDFDNQAVLNEIRDVFKQRDQLRSIISGEPQPKESKRAAIAGRRQDGGHWRFHVLRCPGCGTGYLHHGPVNLYERPSFEDGDGVKITVNGVVPRIEPLKESEIPGRRRSLEISFSCENCEATPVLRIAQDKGQTHVQWLGKYNDQPVI